MRTQPRPFDSNISVGQYTNKTTQDKAIVILVSRQIWAILTRPYTTGPHFVVRIRIDSQTYCNM